MSRKTRIYSIEPDIPESFMGNLLDFIHQQYLRPQESRFSNISRAQVENDPFLAYAVLDKDGTKTLEVQVTGTKPIKVKIASVDPTENEELVEQARQDIVIATELFEEKIRETTLFFAWREGEKIVPENVSGKEKKPINRLFLETQVFLFISFIILGIVLFPLLQWYAPLVLLAVQFIFVIFSPRLIERMSDWKISANNPTIHILEYHLPIEDQDDFKKTHSPQDIREIKKEIYEQTISRNGEIDCEIADSVFTKFGLACSPERLSTKKINVYSLVQKAAQKFGFPIPKIVVSNTLIPNAAASGPSPSRGILLITTGLLVQLEEEQILTVLGHEFGHLKGRDPLLLYGLTGVEFLLRFYVFLPLFPILFSTLLFFIYFWIISTITYFIAKFFEARADLVSAMVIGNPMGLADALEEIGFKRLLFERAPSYRVQEWVSFDPHPPIYFRTERLRRFDYMEKPKYPLFRSVKEVVKGFFDSL